MIEPEVDLESSSCHLGGDQLDRRVAGRDGALLDRDQPSAQLGFQRGPIGDQRRIDEPANRTIDDAPEHQRTEVARFWLGGHRAEPDQIAREAACRLASDELTT